MVVYNDGRYNPGILHEHGFISSITLQCRTKMSCERMHLVVEWYGKCALWQTHEVHHELHNIHAVSSCNGHAFSPFQEPEDNGCFTLMRKRERESNTTTLVR